MSGKKEAKTLSNPKNIIIIVSSGIMVAIIILYSLLWFLGSSREYIEGTTKRLQSETAHHISYEIKMKIDGSIMFVDAASKVMAEYANLHSSEALDMLGKIEEKGDFLRMSVSDINGDSLAVTNYEIVKSFNIFDRDYFAKGMKGEKGVSEVVTSRVNGREVITVYAPIERNNKIVGMVYGVYDVEILSDTIDVSTFDGMGRSYIAQSDGVLIWSSEQMTSAKNEIFNGWNALAELDFDEGNSKQRIYLDVKQKEEGFASYTQNGMYNMLYYEPVGIEDWYIFLIVPERYLESYEAPLTTMALFLVFVVFLGMTVLLAVSILLIRRQLKSTRNVNRNLEFLTNTVPGGVLQFTADEETTFQFISDGFIELTGYSDGEIKEVFQNKFINMISGADREAFKRDLISSKANDRYSEAQFRLKIKGKSSRWILAKAIIDEGSLKERPYFYCICVDIERQRSETLEMKKRAEKDLLTGLFNRTTSETIISKELALGKRSPENYHGFCVLDIDNFKDVNDAYGHVAGDNALKAIAKTLLLHSRKSDIVGRMGGDEFVVFLLDVPSVEMIEAKAFEVCEAIKEIELEDGLSVTASMGISLTPTDGDSFIELYVKADEALYKAKRAGRDRYAFYEKAEEDANEPQG